MRIEELITLSSQELIARLEATGVGRYAIAAAAGITQPQVQRAATGQRQLSEANYRRLLALAVERLT